MKKLPIGRSDFKEIINGNYYYVDKSLFIKEIIEDGSKVLLIPRPRRFGKTLNMSMLRCFYEKTEENHSCLFKNLKINQHKEIMDMQGKYPVIYITFKDIKYADWEGCFEALKYLIKEEYSRHKYLLQGNALEEYEKEEFIRVLKDEAKDVVYLQGLKILSKYLYRYHQQKVVILIDEYDVLIQTGYMKGYYDKIIDFMRIFLSGGLKDNHYLQKGVLIGILRVAKESIFSGLNNLEVCTILKNHYSERFGFLEEEIEEILKYYQIEFEIEKIKKWYNGYIFGRTTVYNPWSILNYIRNFEIGLRPYWVNTSSNDLVRKVLAKGGQTVKIELEDLIKGKDIVKPINEDIVMKDVNKDSENVWSFLLFSGYLKVVHEEFKRGKTYCYLRIPNLEVKYLYEEIILSWFSESVNTEKFDFMLKSLVSGDIKTFGKILKEFVLSSVSYFDTGGNESEKVYHAFVLGMLIALWEDYEVKSNRESGYGRYDVALIPKDQNKIGIIIEFKKVDHDDQETLELAAKNALKQIQDKEYKKELEDRGVKEIIELGIAFEGKNVLVMKRQ
ncbi:MAG: ATP-binding protein [Marinisporobacter sp.]|jgi:hypothetical protein|nr:ATP-binding protein [Marinisporobacter sp.]